MTLDEFHAMFESQGERCKICGVVTLKLHIDHSHKTGKIRGLLCKSCNMGLGDFKDDATTLRAAAAYVEA